MTAGFRPPGHFSWINMLTPEPAAACAFFGELLGWTYAEIPGMGHLIKVGGRGVGGLFDVVSQRTPDGAAPVIGVMLRVEGADEAARRVTDLGGQALPPFDVMQQGRMAVCHDPQGANFDLWEARNGKGTEVDSREPGAPGWFECITDDIESARAFYTGLFGWTTRPGRSSGSSMIFEHGGEPIAALVPMGGEMGETRSQWRTCFTVRSVDQTARRAESLGGTVHFPPGEGTGARPSCGIVSPQGVMFRVIQSVD